MGSRLTWRLGPVNCMESFHTVHSTLVCKPQGKRVHTTILLLGRKSRESGLLLTYVMMTRTSLALHVTYRPSPWQLAQVVPRGQPALSHRGALVPSIHEDLQNKQVKQNLKRKDLRMNMMLGTRRPSRMQKIWGRHMQQEESKYSRL
jgi:hypothetical protein